MVVTVDLPDSNITESFPIGRDGISKDRSLDIPNVWGTVNLFAEGRGQALAQLDLTYGVDVEFNRDIAPKECFDLKIKEFFHGRNKSEIVTKVDKKKHNLFFLHKPFFRAVLNGLAQMRVKLVELLC